MSKDSFLPLDFKFPAGWGGTKELNERLHSIMGSEDAIRKAERQKIGRWLRSHKIAVDGYWRCFDSDCDALERGELPDSAAGER